MNNGNPYHPGEPDKWTFAGRRRERASHVDVAGLPGADVAQRHARGTGKRHARATSRPIGTIFHANLLTRFNAIILVLCVLVLIFGAWLALAVGAAENVEWSVHDAGGPSSLVLASVGYPGESLEQVIPEGVGPVKEAG